MLKGSCGPLLDPCHLREATHNAQHGWHHPFTGGTVGTVIFGVVFWIVVLAFVIRARRRRKT